MIQMDILSFHFVFRLENAGNYLIEIYIQLNPLVRENS